MRVSGLDEWLYVVGASEKAVKKLRKRRCATTSVAELHGSSLLIYPRRLTFDEFETTIPTRFFISNYLSHKFNVVSLLHSFLSILSDIV
jgi:hypothetical protein